MLDNGLHGNVHVLTGNGTNMGSVPFAANDPVFWAHHCNIDRLWASWNKDPNRVNPNTPSFLNQTFTFSDENGVERFSEDQGFFEHRSTQIHLRCI